MQRLLITTFNDLLEVTLDSKLAICSVKVVHSGNGIYFGIAQRKRMIYVAERNLDIHRQTVTAGEPQNAIREYRRSLFGNRLKRQNKYHHHAAFDDLHQIAANNENGLYVTTGKPPFLVRYDVFTERVQPIEIESLLPTELRRTTWETYDRYHFNSVTVDADKVHVLAHNWDRPSFAISFDAGSISLPNPRGVALYTGLGSCCHDIVPAKGGLWTLDSHGSALIRIVSDGNHIRYPIKSSVGPAFPRGLAAFGSYLAVTYGLWSKERTDRQVSDSFLTLFSLERDEFISDQAIGPHGNTCAVLAG